MAEEDRLTANPDDPQEPVVEAAGEEGAPSEPLTEEAVSLMIAQAQERAIREVEEKALRQAQSLSDKTEARLDKRWRRHLGSALAPYEEALAERGAEPGELEDLRKTTEGQLEVRELKAEIQRYKERDTLQAAELAKKEYISQVCDQFGLREYDPRLKRDAVSPDEFLASAMAAWKEDQTKGLKATKTDQQRQRLEQQVAAGELDVVGGGKGMAAPEWSTTSLVLHSDEMAISEELLSRFEKLTPAEMGRLVHKTKVLMKKEPDLHARAAAQRIAMQELRRG